MGFLVVLKFRRIDPPTGSDNRGTSSPLSGRLREEKGGKDEIRSRLFRERFDVSTEEGWTFLGGEHSSSVIYFLPDLLTAGCLTRVAFGFIPGVNSVGPCRQLFRN